MGSMSSKFFTKWGLISLVIISSKSSKSYLFSKGKIICEIPARLAAIVFSFTPPIGITKPVSVNSPVIAILGMTASFETSECSAQAIVIPAEGPSLGVAPAGTCMWIKFSEKNFLIFSSRLPFERIYV